MRTNSIIEYVSRNRTCYLVYQDTLYHHTDVWQKKNKTKHVGINDKSYFMQIGGDHY